MRPLLIFAILHLMIALALAFGGLGASLALAGGAGGVCFAGGMLAERAIVWLRAESLRMRDAAAEGE